LAGNSVLESVEEGPECGEAEESSLLVTATREWLVNTLQAGEDLVFAAVICEVWRLAVALYYL
jgi:hypothetical protein